MKKLGSGKFIRMKREDGAKVLAALRSGEYKQCKGVLHRSPDDTSVKSGRNSEGYCCLGLMQLVLSGDVERIASTWPRQLPTIEWLDNHGITFVNEEQPDMPCVSPTIRVITAPYGEKHLTASEANDIYEMPFSEIADAWEAAMEVY